MRNPLESIPFTFSIKRINLDDADHSSKSKPRWFSFEFMMYYLMLIFAIYKIFKSGWNVSSPMGNPNFDKIKPYLSKGWMSEYIDNSDLQFAAFRNNFPQLCCLMTIFCISSLVLKYNKKTNYLYILGIVSLLVFHGSSLLFIMSLMLVNFAIILLGGKYHPGLIPYLTWFWAIFSLLASEWLFPKITFNSISFGYLSFLDGGVFRGGYHRWWIIYNISILRMISFNIDYYYSLLAFKSNTYKNHTYEKHLNGCKDCIDNSYSCEKLRSITNLDPSEYNLCIYFSYLLYTPLYISGPIITFNNFCSQLKSPLSISSRYKALYFLRLVIAAFAMEWIMHNFYVVAIQNGRAWDNLSTLDMLCIGYWNLKSIWLKLLVIWRFARFWSLVDGIDAPENMIRCMSNNYSGLGFWRSWHRSFNQWIVRYIYIPLGGSKSVFLNIWIIFTFVALWHDRTLKLLVWGWLISLFIAPELLLQYLNSYFEAKTWKSYRVLAGIAGTLNVYLMSIANLAGFSIGLGGVSVILASAYSVGGSLFFIGSFLVIFSAVQIMFEIREQEFRSTGVLKNY